MRHLTTYLTLLALAITFGSAQAADTAADRIGLNDRISFEEGKSDLSPDARARLRNLVTSARAHGEIAEVQIAVWSDNETPINDKSLSKLDRDLADRRAQRVEDYLEDQLNVDAAVRTYNMAERANWLSKLLNTREAEIKSAVRSDGRDVSPEEFRIFKDNGKPSTAVVLVRYRTEVRLDQTSTGKPAPVTQ